VQLQSLHWNPVPQERLGRSVWGSAQPDEGADIQEADLEELEKLFGASQAQAQPGPAGGGGKKSAWAEGGGGPGAGEGRKSATLQLYMLDAKRAQNIVIGLAQFKSVAPDTFALLRAVCSLDGLSGRLTGDHLENLSPLLPTAPEMKRISDLAQSSHPAEVFVRVAASFYPELPRRLQCFSTCVHFRTSVSAAQDKARALVTACKEVVSSDKLARLLQKMLAVGNVMNQGTYRGQASGFTVDSLLKIIQTKGTSHHQPLSCPQVVPHLSPLTPLSPTTLDSRLSTLDPTLTLPFLSPTLDSRQGPTKRRLWWTTWSSPYTTARRSACWTWCRTSPPCSSWG